MHFGTTAPRNPVYFYRILLLYTEVTQGFYSLILNLPLTVDSGGMGGIDGGGAGGDTCLWRRLGPRWALGRGPS